MADLHTPSPSPVAQSALIDALLPRELLTRSDAETRRARVTTTGLAVMIVGFAAAATIYLLADRLNARVWILYGLSTLLTISTALLHVHKDLNRYTFWSLMIVVWGLGGSLLAIGGTYGPPLLVFPPVMFVAALVLDERWQPRTLYVSVLIVQIVAFFASTLGWVATQDPVSTAQMVTELGASLVTVTASYLIGLSADQERRRTEEQLQLRHHRFEVAVASSNVGVLQWNVATNETRASDALAQITGIPLERLTNAEVDVVGEFLDDRDQTAVFAFMQALTTSEDPQRVEVRLRTDPVRWIEIYASRTTVDGDLVVIAAVRDITEVKDELRRRTEFIALASHEIRTPVNGIIGMVHLLEATPLSRQQRRWIERLAQSGEHLAETVRDVLDFSVLTSDRVELDDEEIDVRRLVGQTMTAVSTRRPHRVDLAAYIDPTFPQSITGDVSRLRQILTNLLSNALKFTPEGHVKLSVTGRDGSACFVVADSGVGIRDDALERIFEPFRQEDASSTRRVGGQGLGLAISRGLAERMGGTLTVQSRYGEGSSFTLTIPCEATAAPTQTDLAGTRIVVDVPKKVTSEVIVTTVEALNATVLPLAAGATDADVYILSDDTPALETILHRLLTEANARVLVVTSGLEQAVPDVVEVPYPVDQQQLERAILRVLGFAPLPTPSPALTIHRHMGDVYPLDILVAEDDPINSEITQMLLAHLGYECEVVADGLAAVRAARARDYDLILLDLHMPELDGLGAMDEIRASHGDNPPTLVAFTADAALSAKHLNEAGFDSMLAKPIDIHALGRLLETTHAARHHTPGALPTMPTPVETNHLFPQLLGVYRDSPREIVETLLEVAHHVFDAAEMAIRERTAERPGAIRRAIVLAEALGALGVVRSLMRALETPASPAGDADAVRQQVDGFRDWCRKEMARERTFFGGTTPPPIQRED